jgi:hypothetical protein
MDEESKNESIRMDVVFNSSIDDLSCLYSKTSSGDCELILPDALNHYIPKGLRNKIRLKKTTPITKKFVDDYAYSKIPRNTSIKTASYDTMRLLIVFMCRALLDDQATDAGEEGFKWQTPARSEEDDDSGADRAGMSEENHASASIKDHEGKVGDHEVGAEGGKVEEEVVKTEKTKKKKKAQGKSSKRKK